MSHKKIVLTVLGTVLLPLYLAFALLFALSAHAEELLDRVAGKILLQVEQHGEAWYVDPLTQKRHYLGHADDAYTIMGDLGLGIASEELDGYLSSTFPARLAGHIMIDVGRNGEAYYVYPEDLKGYYLERPADAYTIMSELGLGISDGDLAQVPITLGYSEHGRPIGGHVIGDGEYCVFLLGAIHGGRERGGEDLLERFLEDYFEYPRLVHPDKRLIAIPLANPDGYETRTDKLNANEVNLNRNFLTTDWLQGQYGTDKYAGNQPFSESASRIIRDVAAGCTDGAMVAFHARGDLVNPESSERSAALAKWYAEKSGYGYFEGWHYAGTATRWFEETTGNPAVTVEMTDYTTIDWDMNKDALTELLSGDVTF